MESAAAARAAEETAKRLRSFLDIYFAAAEEALAAEGDARAQLGRSAAFERWLLPSDERRRADYEPMEALAADPEALARTAAKALYAAKPADLLHFREGPKGWEVALGAYKIMLIRRAPRLMGSPSTELCRGPSVAGAFSAARLTLQPEQASLHEIYREFGGLDAYEWSDADWEAAWAREERVYRSLWERYEKAGVVGGAPSAKGTAKIALRAAARAQAPLLGRAAEAAREKRAYEGRVACASDGAERLAQEMAKELTAAGMAAETRQLWTMMPGAEDATVWAVKLRGGGAVCDVSNMPELAPMRAVPVGDAWVAAAPAQLQHYAAELWTIETLEKRKLLDPRSAAARQREILAAMRGPRKLLRDPREWTAGKLYGYVRGGVRRAGHIKADPQFPAAKFV